jgi:hypothetical protein
MNQRRCASYPVPPSFRHFRALNQRVGRVTRVRNFRIADWISHNVLLFINQNLYWNCGNSPTSRLALDYVNFAESKTLDD